MTTVTIDEECLDDLDKLQSLLKLKFNKLYGTTVTRGTAVKWAVNNSIYTLTNTLTIPNQSFNSASVTTNTYSTCGTTTCVYSISSTGLSSEVRTCQPHGN